MSTRTNILITKGDTKIWLYRHCDGYPRVTGYNLASCLAECGKMNGFLTLLLDQKDESTMYRPATPIYEFTTQMHGDIEYLYKIQLFYSIEGLFHHLHQHLQLRDDYY